MFFTSEDTKNRIVYQGQTQAKNFSVELNCLGWALALMNLVYSFIKKEETVRGSPPFEVPQMRFVQAGLAIQDQHSKDSEGTTGSRQNAYLLEEFIDSEDPGWFVKYLNNNSAKPYKFKDKDRSIRAEFLSFSQHVQFIETGNQAFLSNLQGRSPSMKSLNSASTYLLYFTRWTDPAHRSSGYHKSVCFPSESFLVLSAKVSESKSVFFVE